MSLYQEIVRRRLPQTAALYIAIAWGGTEILVFLADALLGGEAAANARRYLAILLIAGFPAAMYLAWSRDLGLKARRFFAAGVVAVLITGGLLATLGPADVADSPFASEHTLAVVPFDVCEERLSDVPLAAGLTREVFTRLAQRDYLKVRGQTSVRTVLERAPSQSVAADLLDVNYLLTGIVCREGLDLTLETELVDNKGFVVWEAQYEQGVNQADQVEVRLAALVDSGVATMLGDATAAVNDGAIDRRAHEQILIGYGHAEVEDYDKARTAFETALDIQPGLAEAVWALSWFEDSREERKPVVEQALDLALAALERNPYDFKANKIAGRILFSLGRLEEEIAYRDYDELGDEGVLAAHARAQAHFKSAERYARSALALSPSDTEVRGELVFALDRQDTNRRKESLAILEDGFQYEPFNPDLTELASFRLVEFGRTGEAMDLIDRFEALPQGKEWLWWVQLEILQNSLRHDEKLAYVIEMLENDLDAARTPGMLSQVWWTIADIAWLGLYELAEPLHRTAERIPNPVDTGWMRWARQLFLVEMYQEATGHAVEVIDSTAQECVDLSVEEILDKWSLESGDCAWAFWETGDEARALELLEALQHHKTAATIWAERKVEFKRGLAELYFEMEHDEKGLAVADDMVRILESEVGAGARHPNTLALLTDAYVMQGNYDSALETLHRAIDYGFWRMDICCAELLINPLYTDTWQEELGGDPDFELALSRMRGIVETQRANIRTLLSQHDMQQLLEPLTVDENAEPSPQ